MDIKQYVMDSVARHTEQLSALNEEIWGYAELDFRVRRSADALCKVLVEEGFELKRGLAGIDHAFSATYGAGAPVIGILAEYDALSGLSQAAGCPTYNPLVPGGNGHGCGHSAMAAGCFGAAVAIKEYLQETGHSGTVILYGCPAEENGWAKAFMARDHCFDELDVALAWHPETRNFVTVNSNLANISIEFHFKGISAHAAGAPEQGRSALDACELMNVGVNYLREHVISSARIHYAYLDAGATSPNVVQDRSSLHYFVRAPKSTQALEISERIKNVARGAALMTGTEVDIIVRSGMSNIVQNYTLDEVLYEAFSEVGGPAFDEDDYALAAAFFKNLPEQNQQNIKNELIRSLGEEAAEEVLTRPLNTGVIPYVKPYETKHDPVSSDVGDVSYVVPTVQIYVACACMGTALHSWNFTGQTNSSIGMKGTLKSSEVMALAAIKLLDRPEVIAKAKEEHLLATGGVYPCPIPDDVTPPPGN